VTDAPPNPEPAKQPGSQDSGIQSDNTANGLSLVDNEQLAIDRALLLITRRQFYSNVILALSTVALAVVTWTWQVSYSTYFLRRSSEDQIRPYVFPISISKTDTNEALIAVRNVGATPAFSLMVIGERFIQPFITTGALKIDPIFSTDCLTEEQTTGMPGHPGIRQNLGANETLSTFLDYIKTPNSLPSWRPEVLNNLQRSN